MVEYKPYPTVKPEEARRTAAIPEVHLQFPVVQLSHAPAEAFGAIGRGYATLGSSMHTVGQAINTLGESIGGAGDKIFHQAMEIQKTQDEKNVNQALIDYEIDQTGRNEKFLQSKGDAANTDNLKAHLDEAERFRVAARGKLRSPYEQKLFDAASTHTFIADARRMASHSATEQKGVAIGAVEARQNLEMSHGMAQYEDMDFFQNRDKLAALVAAEAQLKGWGKDSPQAELRYRQLFTKMVVGRAEFIGLKDSAKAIKFLDDNREQLDALDPQLYLRTYEKLKSDSNDTAGRRAVDEVRQMMKDKPDATEEEWRQETARKIEQNEPGNVPAAKRADDRARIEYNIQRREAEQEDLKTWRNIQNIGFGYQTKSGKKPLTLEDAMAEPGFKEWWRDARHPERKHMFEEILRHNSEHDIERTPETDAIFHYWTGRLKYEDPQQAAAEIAADPSAISGLKIPQHDRDRLYEMYVQERVREGKSDAWLRLESGYKQLKSENRIPKSIWQNKTNLATFKGVLGELAEKRQQDLKRPLNVEDWRELNNKAQEDITTPGRFWGVWKTPYYQDFKVTPEFRQSYLNDHPGASDQEIQSSFAKYKMKTDLKSMERKPALGPGPRPATLERPGGG